MDLWDEIDKWDSLFSARTSHMASSEIRELLALTVRPEVISFAGGLPEVSLLDKKIFKKYLLKTLSFKGDSSLQYGESTGYLPLKSKLAEIMSLEGIKANKDDIIITAGSQHSLDLIAKILIDPGDTVITEAPCYTGALNAFRAYQANIVGMPVDKDGMIIKGLDKKLESLSSKGVKVKFIYLVSNFSNPSGITMSLERRKRLLDIAAENRIMIVEDNPYGMLRYGGKPVRLLKDLDTGRDGATVIYTSTLSKLFAPGFRIGWTLAPKAILEKMILGVQSTVLCVSTFAQRVAFEYFSDNLWKENIVRFRGIYKGRRDTMLDSLESHLSSIAEWSMPEGGYFIWLRLPKYLDSKDLLKELIRKNVAYVPGTAFYPDGRGINEARLAFCSEDKNNIEKGIRIMSQVIRSRLQA